MPWSSCLRDVAVEDGAAAEVAVAHDQADGVAGREVHGVLPGAHGLGDAVAVDDLERVGVEVEGWWHHACAS